MKKQIKSDKNIMKSVLGIKQDDLSKEKVNSMLKTVIKRLENNNLYSESSWVIKEYKHLHYALDGLYSFIYNPSKSNLSLEDAEVFASYAVQQSKKLKNIIDIMADNKV